MFNFDDLQQQQQNTSFSSPSHLPPPPSSFSYIPYDSDEYDLNELIFRNHEEIDMISNNNNNSNNNNVDFFREFFSPYNTEPPHTHPYRDDNDDTNFLTQFIDDRSNSINILKGVGGSGGGMGRGTSPMGGASTSGGAGGIQNCPECGKSFTNKSALAKHRLIHSNERKYSCHLCDKSFKRQDHLNGHLQTHQERKPFVCKAPGCDKSYCDSRSLKRHVESQHQDYLALLANGNPEALNFLPSIGKLKANVAPNLQQEIIVETTDVVTGAGVMPGVSGSEVTVAATSIVPILVNVDDKAAGSNQKNKGFFT